MYDTEWGFGIVKNPFGVPGPAYLSNFLDYYSRLKQLDNAPQANFMMYSLLENINYRNDLANRYSDYLNTIYSTEQVIPQIMALKSAIEAEVPRHLERWSKEFNEFDSDAIETMDDWHGNIDKVIEFAEKRPYYTRLNMVSEFGLSGIAEVTLDVSDSSAGNIQISTLTISEFPWTGTYFQDIPVKLTAIPAPGYAFAGWIGAVESASVSISVSLTEVSAITALFVEESSAKNTIAFNEINYNSSAMFDPGDWVELYNAYDNPMDISGWTFKDSDEANSFIIPDGTIIPAGGYFVLSRDAAKFSAAFTTVTNFIGDFRFGLNNAGEKIMLLDTRGEIVDSLTYNDEAPWPVGPDGTGPSLELGSTDLDNNEAVNWIPSSANGTPGIANNLVLGVDENENRDTPSAFSLGQNYPNPFNPMTTIPFSVPESGRVTIEVYSILGQRVAKVIDDNLSPGHYQAVLKAGHLASGIYFYRIEANGFTQTKSMLLLK